MTETGALEAIEQAIARKENELLALRQAAAVLRGEQTTAVAIAGLPKSRDFADLGIVAGTKQLLREQGPMDTRNIADQLLDRGLRTRSKNFVATVYATLDNSPAFKRDRKTSLWSLAEGESA